MTRLVSAEEARELLEGATPGPWIANLDDDKRAASRDWRVVDTDVRLVVGADWYERHSAGETETVCGVKIAKVDADLIAAAPDLAATVIALSESAIAEQAIADEACRARDAAQRGARDHLGALRVAQAERDRLRDILACERGEWAPEGWEAVIQGDRMIWMSADLRRGFVIKGGKEWHWSPAPAVESLPFATALEALEAIEAADRAPAPK